MSCNLHFSIRLSIRHPNIDPSEITRTLNIIPRDCWQIGSPRRAPNGVSRPGVYKESGWTKDWDVDGRRNFFGSVDETLNILEPGKELLNRIVETSGSIYLVVHLAGSRNIGSDLTFETQSRLSAFGIRLGIEVFPDM